MNRFDELIEKYFENDLPFERQVENFIIGAPSREERDRATGEAYNQVEALGIKTMYGPFLSALIAVHLLAEMEV
ncbi:MAG: hypothetical protein HY827_10300 [Actinobacteria bacterium]|nr:hypothetical protein [Actinomycetota bacterium]